MYIRIRTPLSPYRSNHCLSYYVYGGSIFAQYVNVYIYICAALKSCVKFDDCGDIASLNIMLYVFTQLLCFAVVCLPAASKHCS